MLVEVPLEFIIANPYQPRTSENPEHIKALAMSIGENGLMQAPAGRLVSGDANGWWPVSVLETFSRAGAKAITADSNRLWDDIFASGCRVQLAFGHSRLAAFEFLRDTGNRGFERMTVNVQDIEKEQMFRWAVGENIARKNLTVLEEARAMQRYQQEFNRTSEEVGALFGVSGSTVRGKIRLLELPADIQEQVSPNVNESAVRALLALVDLPAELRDKAEGHWDRDIKPSAILQDALSGEDTGDGCLKRVGQIPLIFGKDITSGTLWKHDDNTLTGDGVLGPCKGCPNLLRSGNKIFCLASKCYHAKRRAYILRYLEQASEISGIPVASEDKIFDRYSTAYTTFASWKSEPHEALEHARAGRCPNLVLVWLGDASASDGDTLKAEGFEHARIVCRRHNVCTCQKASDAGMNIVAPAPAPISREMDAASGATNEIDGGHSVEQQASVQISEEYLKEQNRQLREARRQELAEIRAMYEDATNRLAKGMREFNPMTWWSVACQVHYSARSAAKPPDNWRDGSRIDLVDDLWRWIAGALARHVYNPDDGGTMLSARNTYNRLLIESGLDPFEDDDADTPASMAEALAVSVQPETPGVAIETVQDQESYEGEDGMTLSEIWSEEPADGYTCDLCGEIIPHEMTCCPHCGWEVTPSLDENDTELMEL